ncbi:hypothetical protein QUF70_20790 [Desulfobacterales bacterium HSG17]|nr:hypothetical protein [Desulfobacterales bacterium HSG17]
MKLSKKHIILILSVSLLIISIIYRVLNPFEQQKVDKLTYTGKKISKTDIPAEKFLTPEKKLQSQTQHQPQTLVSKFLNKPEISAKIYKDLFSIYKPPSKQATVKKVYIPVDKDIKTRQITKTIKKDPVQEIKEYLCSYRVYGTYKSENTKAVFLSNHNLVLCATIEHRLAGLYLIDDIPDTYITLKALALNETIHLDMREFNNE